MGRGAATGHGTGDRLGFLANPAKDWLEAYKRNWQPPFRIRHWEKPALERTIAKLPNQVPKHGIIAEEVRTFAEITAAEQEYFDNVWYVRKLIREEKVLAKMQVRDRTQATLRSREPLRNTVQRLRTHTPTPDRGAGPAAIRPARHRSSRLVA